MQYAAEPGVFPVFCTTGPDAREGCPRHVRGKLLGSNVSAAGGLRWHELSDMSGMIPLLLAFFAIGALMCALIGLDRHMGDVVETMHHNDPLKFSSSAPEPEVEHLPGLAVESSHTAAGFARSK